MPETINETDRMKRLHVRHREEKERRKRVSSGHQTPAFGAVPEAEVLRVPRTLTRTKTAVLADELKERVLAVMSENMAGSDVMIAVETTFNEFNWVWPYHNQPICEKHGPGTCCQDD